MTPEMINAIAGLWPLALLVFVTVSLVIYRKEFRSTLARLTKLELKRGETSVSLTQEVKSVAELPAGTAVQMEPEKSGEEKKEEALVEEEGDAGWLIQMMKADTNGDVIKGELAYKKLQEAEPSAAQQRKNEGLHLYFQYRGGNETALRKLQDLAVRTKDMPEVFPFLQSWLGSIFDDAGNFDEAISRYESAASIEGGDVETRAGYIVSLSHSLYKSGKSVAAYQRLGREISLTRDPAVLSKLYEELAALYQLDGNHEMRAIAADKAIEYQPNDTSLLFNAAYSYSESSLNSMAVLLYNALLRFKPDNSTALNNIAITYKQLGMVVKSVSSLKKAVSLHETLAASNLAYAYLREGFVDEALELLNEANKQNDPHQNVGSAFAAAKAQKEQEDNLLSETQKIATQQRKFLRDFAAAYFAEAPNIPSLSGMWKDEKEAVVEVSQVDSKIKAEWSGEKKLILTGNRSNAAFRIEGFVDKTNQYINTSLADKGYGCIDNGGNKIYMMIIKDGQHSFKRLIRSDDLAS